MTATVAIDTTLEGRKARWLEFFKPGAQPGFLFHVYYPDPSDELPPDPPRWPEKVAERIESAWQRYEVQRRRTEWIHDDLVPYLDNRTGTEIFAEALGCSVSRPSDTMPYAHAYVGSASEAARVKVPKLSQSSLAYLFDIADELLRRAGPDAVMKLVDVQSPMDVAALVWRKENLFVAMLEEPEAVKELAAKARELLIAFFDEWFGRYGTEYMSHHPNTFMSGGLTLSEDEIGAVSAEMMAEFFLPELEALSSHFGGLGIHCCAQSQHQWENFRRVPGLRALNLHPPHGSDPDEWIGAAFQAFGNHCVHVPSWTPSGDPRSWPDKVPEDIRIFFPVQAKSRDEAIAITEALNQHPRRFTGAKSSE